jgi:hypothetical protein
MSWILPFGVQARDLTSSVIDKVFSAPHNEM